MSKNTNNNIAFVFFGTPDIAVTVLEELKAEDLFPQLIVTAPDRKQGRGMKLTPPAVKVWAEKHNIPVLQPEKLKEDNVAETLKDSAPKGGFDVFVVAAYGKIIPKEIIDIPTHGTLNVHPSLLPKHRGPSPIQAQILGGDKEMGVTIMQIDEEMDHGPLLGQTELTFDEVPKASELEDILGTEGGKLLAYLMPEWIAGKVPAIPQEHDKATYCHFIKKEDALIDLNDDAYQNFLKIQAYDMWPVAYFMTAPKSSNDDRAQKKIRVKITGADYKNGGLVIKKVIPEGKKEMEYEAFLKA